MYRTALLLSGFALLATIALSSIVFAFLPLSPERDGLTVGCLVGGLIVSMLVYVGVNRLPNRRSSRVAAITALVLLGLLPLLSCCASRITLARFGFTVYGAIPIPVLDITINRHGVLWFRPKTHRITRAELDKLITPNVDVIVVGIGWDSVAQLSDEAMKLAADFDLRILPTPDAFALYNTLKAEGRTVVLLAHSTC